MALKFAAVVDGLGAEREELRRFNPSGAIHGPLGVMPAQRRQVLRLLVVPNDAEPMTVHGLVAVGVEWLASELQSTRDPDDVWLRIATLDVSLDGWFPLAGPPVWCVRGVSHPLPPTSLLRLLRRCGLPPLWRWQSVHHGPDEVWQLVTVDGPTVVHAGPEHDVAVGIDMSRVPDLDRELAVAFSASLLPDLARGRNAVPLSRWRSRRRLRYLHLRASWADTTRGLPPAADLRIGADCGARRIALVSDGDLLGTAAADPHRLRAALASCVAEAAGLRHGGTAHARFVRAWTSAPAGIKVSLGSASRALRGHDEALETVLLPEIRSRLYRAAGASLDPPHPVTGRRTVRLLNEQVVPHLLSSLEQLVLAVSSEDAVLTALSHVQRLVAGHLRDSERHAYALNGPWSADWRRRGLHASRESRLASRAAELTAEIAIRLEPRAGRSADRIDARLWTAIATAALECALDSQSSYAGLTDLRIDIGEDAELHLLSRPRSHFDAQTYLAARQLLAQESAAQHAVSLDLANALPLGDEIPYQTMEEVDPDGVMTSINDALLGCTGTRLGPLFGLLRTAADMDPDARGVVLTTAEELLADVATWTGEPHAELRAALDLLSLDHKSLRDADLQFWKLERREIRLATRPLLRLDDDRIAFAPARVRRTQLLFVSYLNDGRLPWPPSERLAPVRDACAAWRAKGDLRLEQVVARDLTSAGLAVKARVRSRRKGLSWLPGEVDVLAADPKHRRVWVVEAKRPYLAFSSVEIADEVGDIHGPRWSGGGRRNRRDEARLLQRKAEACATHLLECLAYLGIDAPEQLDTWTVHPAIVTPQVCAAAFFDDPIVLFTLADQIAEIVQLSAVPPYGFVLLAPDY